MKYLAMALVRLYQKWISPLKPPCCRFYPTCSAYALEAFRKRGFFVGLALTFWRILRCNPFCRPGLDPVPDRKAKYPKVPLSRNRERVQPQEDSAVSTYPAPASDPKDNTTK